jgi:hypothetical protein
MDSLHGPHLVRTLYREVDGYANVVGGTVWACFTVITTLRILGLAG